MKTVPAFLRHTDFLTGEGVVKATKKLKDAAFFADKTGVDPELVLYDVYAREDVKKPGELNWGLTVLHPVTVNGECSMTRGHWHEDTDAAEYYWCLGGTGLLYLMDEDGTAWCEEMAPGSLHHIPGTLAHRLVNTGDEDLKVAACWPTTAGHDYARVEATPFPERAYKEEGEIVWK